MLLKTWLIFVPSTVRSFDDYERGTVSLIKSTTNSTSFSVPSITEMHCTCARDAAALDVPEEKVARIINQRVKINTICIAREIRNGAAVTSTLSHFSLLITRSSKESRRRRVSLFHLSCTYAVTRHSRYEGKGRPGILRKDISARREVRKFAGIAERSRLYISFGTTFIRSSPLFRQSGFPDTCSCASRESSRR